MRSATVSEQPYISGEAYGLPASTLVHRLANIAGTLEAGEHCRIDAFVTITGRVKMGHNCHLGTGSMIFGAAGFEMGDGCSLSPGAKVFTASIDVDCGLLALHAQCTLERGGHEAPVRLGNYSLLLADAVVLPGVTIGSQVVVGAKSLVTRDLPSQGVYAGTPARFLRSRPVLKYAD